jgi:two-component system nitrogen regulation sensor histidine kinase NtrY
MSFRRKLLIALTLIVVLAVGVVGALMSWRTKRVFEHAYDERTSAAMEQFRKLFEQRQREVSDRIRRVTDSEAVQKIAADLAQGGDPAVYVNEAKRLADANDLDLLELVASDGSIVSSAQFAARFGYKEPVVLDGSGHATPFLKKEELPDRTVLGVEFVGKVSAADKPLYVIGGEKMDQQFLASLPLPSGMRSILYSGAGKNFDPSALAVAASPSGGRKGNPEPANTNPEKLAPVVQEALHHDEMDAVVHWTGDMADSERFHTMTLRNEVGAPVGLLMVGASRREMVLLQRQLRAIAMIVMAIGIFTAVLASGWIAARITRPVEALAAAAREVGSGHWDTKLEVRTNDEFGQLAATFNTMTRELVEQRERLVQAERVAAWRELARRLAHELKNPLFPLQITVENMVRARQLPPAEFEEVFSESAATMLAELRNLKTIIGRFSDFSKMPRPQLQRVDANELVRNVVRLHEAQLKSAPKPIEVIVDTDPQVGAIDADPDLLHRVLANLVLNAMDAMPDGGNLTVRTRLAGERAMIEVSDTGVGLTNEETERLFTPYYTTKQHGTGLGLAITQSVIADHHGTITVRSTPGRGATFHIELPTRQPDSAHVTERGAAGKT